MKSNRGFTLIEILVVIVVIALLVSITALNTSGDPREDILKQQAQRLHFYLEEATDEAILNNQNIGLHITKFSIHPYSWKKTPSKNTIDSTNQNNENENENENEEWSWVNYTSRNLAPIEFENNLLLQLSINNTQTPLSFHKNNTKTLQPQIIIQSSGIQSLSKLSMGLTDYNKLISISGNGAGRFKVSSLFEGGIN